MHIITVNFEAKAGQEEQFLARVLEQAGDSLTREDGCLQFDVCVTAEAPERFFLYEVYRDEAAFDAHLKSAHFKDFSAATKDWVAQKSVSVWTRVPSPR